METHIIKSTLSLRLLLILLFSSVAGCQGCLGPSVPEGRILIVNDSQDREFNIVKVSGGGTSASLAPGESVLLSKGTSNISFSRTYKDHTKYYRVTCPRKLGSGIVIKLIDVHTNRMPGGCETVDGGKR